MRFYPVPVPAEPEPPPFLEEKRGERYPGASEDWRIDMNNFDRAMAYLKKLPAANSGSGGHNATLRAACECYRFGLSDAEALEAMQWFNQNLCNPAWSDGELQHKLNDAAKIVNTKGEKRAPMGKQSKTFVPPTVTAKRKAKPIIEQSYEAEEAWWARVFAERGITDPTLEII